jgi:hypothetical protein
MGTVTMRDDGQLRRDPQHHRQHADDGERRPLSSWLSDCCMLCATLSMSLVTRLSRSPRGWRST